jgi:transcriptional regulator NrdR family protein
LLLIPSLSWGLGENIKNNKDTIKEKIQDKVEVARSNNNNSSVSSANKELIHQFKNNFTTIEELEEALTSAVKEQGKDALFQDIVTTIEKKIIVAENLYKKLNENDLNEITNLLIALRVLDKTSYLHFFDVKSHLYEAVHRFVPNYCVTTSQKLFPPGAPQITFYQTICE